MFEQRKKDEAKEAAKDPIVVIDLASIDCWRAINESIDSMTQRRRFSAIKECIALARLINFNFLLIRRAMTICHQVGKRLNGR